MNIDTEASAEQAVGEYYGNIQVNEILQGTSGATAVVQNRRIVTDRLSQYRGAFFIPNPSEDTNPRWVTGTRTMRFTTSETDSRLEGSVDSSAQVEYLASGTLNTIQENILSVRKPLGLLSDLSLTFNGLIALSILALARFRII